MLDDGIHATSELSGRSHQAACNGMQWACQRPVDLLLHRSFASLACAGCFGCGLTLVITNCPDQILARRPAELAHRNKLLDTEAKIGVQRQPVAEVKPSVARCKV